jgi:hypothetical protein
LWQSTVKAIIARDHETATDEKTKIEDRQREEAAKRAEQGVEWHPRLFRAVHSEPGGSEEGEEGLDWIINAHVDSHDPELAKKQIKAIAPIFEGETWDNFEIPAYKSHSMNGADMAAAVQSENEKPEPLIPDTKPTAAKPEIKQEVVERTDSKTNEVDKYVDAAEETKP